MEKVILFLLGFMNGMPMASIINYKLGLFVINNSKYSLFKTYGYECTQTIYILVNSLFIAGAIGITAWSLKTLHSEGYL